MLGTHEATTEADRINGRRIIGWSLAWAATVLVATAVLASDTISGPAAWLVAAVCAAIGVGGLGAYRRYVAEADELTRQIQLEGIAFGFGLGVLVTLSWSLFEFAGAPVLNASTAGTVMIFGYIGGVLLATHRYR